MSRSKWKVPYVDINEVKKAFFKKKKIIKSRSSTIPFLLLNKTVEVYNGRFYRKVLVTRNKVGFKFGEFALTRNASRKFINLKKNKKKISAKANPKGKPKGKK